MQCVYQVAANGVLQERRVYQSTFRWERPVIFADGVELQSFAPGQWASAGNPNGVGVGTQVVDARTIRYLFVPPTHVVQAEVRDDATVVTYRSSGGTQGAAVSTVCDAME